MMKCVHICNDFLGSKVHKNLYEKLDKLHVCQKIFYPKRDYVPRGKEKMLNFAETKSQIIGSDKFKLYHRILFRLKIRTLFKDLESRVDLENIDIVHATTLFSDGAIALKIFKKYHKPYVVAIRMTDMSIFFKYRPDLRSLGHEILTHAQKILFVSNTLKVKFFGHKVIEEKKKKYIPKSMVINNGIDSFWLSNINKRKNLTPCKLLFVGRFLKRKHVSDLMNAFFQLRTKYKNLALNLVGTGGSEETHAKTMAAKDENIKFHGPIFNKKELLKMYRANDIFLMPAHNETFGLVYAEALSQGLPILYAEGEGFDGVINKKIGESIAPISTQTIYAGIEKIINRYDSYELDTINFDQFNWLNIAERYKKLYQDII